MHIFMTFFFCKHTKYRSIKIGENLNINDVAAFSITFIMKYIFNEHKNLQLQVGSTTV
jgi:hypothetical protein